MTNMTFPPGLLFYFVKIYESMNSKQQTTTTTEKHPINSNPIRSSEFMGGQIDSNIYIRMYCGGGGVDCVFGSVGFLLLLFVKIK